MKAVITGASSGIGREMAIILAALGYDLVLVARNESLLQKLKNDLPETDVTVFPADLTDESACRELYKKFSGNTGVLINNAGFGLVGAFDKTRLETELEMIDLNIRAVHILTKLFLVDYKRRNKGYILNVSSAAGFLPGPLMSTYYATKAYVLQLTQAVWQELRKSGSEVKISALCPGPVPTEFNRKANVKNISGKGIDAHEVALCGIKGMFAGKRVIVPGTGMKLALCAQKLAPARAALSFAYARMLRKGIDDKMM